MLDLTKCPLTVELSYHGNLPFQAKILVIPELSLFPISKENNMI